MPAALEWLRELVGSAELTAFLVAGAVTLVVAPLVAHVARRAGYTDAPGGRRLHDRPVPRLGGVAIFAGMLAGLLVVDWATFDEPARIGVLAACAAFVFFVGAVDDIRGLGPAPRVFAEIVAATVLIESGFVIDVVATPFGEPIRLGVLAIPITIAWFVGVTNAFNLIDGLDGLMSTVGLVALLGCALVAGAFGGTTTMLTALVLAGALLGFLRWNWSPASLFPGDSGSLLVGFVVAALSIDAARTGEGFVHAHVPLLLCAVPLAETGLTLARRYAAGQPYFTGDQSHVHHVLLKRGLSVRNAVLALTSCAVMLASVGVLSRSWRSTEAFVTMTCLFAIVPVALARLGYIEFRVAWERFRSRLLQRPRRSLATVVALARAGESVRHASTLGEFRDRLRSAVVEGRLTLLALELTPLGLDAVDWAGPISETRNERASRYSETACEDTRWIFSTEQAPDPDGQPRDVHVRVCIPLPEDGRYGRLICETSHVRASEATPMEAYERYLAEPVAHTLRMLHGVLLERRKARAQAAGRARRSLSTGPSLDRAP